MNSCTSGSLRENEQLVRERIAQQTQARQDRQRRAGALPPELGALELAYVLLACWAWWAVPWSHVWANALVWLCLCCVDLALAGGGWDGWAAQLRGTSFQAIWPLALSMAVAVAWSELRGNWMSLEEERVK